jgi:cell division GTPase FtsZ
MILFVKKLLISYLTFFSIMNTLKPEPMPDPDDSKKTIEIDQWIINSPDKVKIIGCGELGTELILNIYAEYPSKLEGIKYRTINQPTKPDYLDLRLTPDLRNIRSADIKNDVENDLGTDKIKENIEMDASRPSVLNKIRSLIGPRQKTVPKPDADIEVQNAVRPEDEMPDQRDFIVKKAKEDLKNELNEFLPETDLLFIISDFKSPFGLDNSLRVSEHAKKSDIITVGVVVLPTSLDKLEEVEYGNRALQSFRLNADIVIVIPQLEHIIEGYLVLIISELLELMTTSGLVNLDVADVKNVVGDGNVAMLGFGSGRGTDEDKIMGAINEVVTSPLLNIDLDGVTRTLVSVVGDRTMTVTEAQKAAKVILEKIQPGARLIWGAGINTKLAGAIKVMVMIGVKPKNILVHIYANS